ncbi:MAG: PIN domain-containing protein [Chitinophagales bacterium]
MRKFILDTSVLIHLVRDSETWEFINNTYRPLDAPNESAVSFATVAELYSLAIQLGWGAKKVKKLEYVLNNFPIYEIDDYLLVPYIEIDTFSQGKHPSLPLRSGLSARNMGKNDIGIAATAFALKAELITTDKDFDHLKEILEDVHCVMIR